jgi:hypothetical protein
VASGSTWRIGARGELKHVTSGARTKARLFQEMEGRWRRGYSFQLTPGKNQENTLFINLIIKINP